VQILQNQPFETTRHPLSHQAEPTLPSSSLPFLLQPPLQQRTPTGQLRSMRAQDGSNVSPSHPGFFLLVSSSQAHPNSSVVLSSSMMKVFPSSRSSNLSTTTPLPLPVGLPSLSPCRRDAQTKLARPSSSASWLKLKLRSRKTGQETRKKRWDMQGRPQRLTSGQ
jgi:hypothetical protein